MCCYIGAGIEKRDCMVQKFELRCTRIKYIYLKMWTICV